MPQYKKSDIDEKIKCAALRVFALKGFENTKISEISGEAKVSVGNIYRYYKSKDEVFYSVIPENILDKLKDILSRKISSAKSDDNEGDGKHVGFGLINEEFVEFMVLNREKLLVLFLGSKGTRYAGFKEEIIACLMDTVKERYAGEKNPVVFDTKNHETIKMIYEKLIEMMMIILKKDLPCTEVKKSFQVINQYHLFGAVNLFK